MLNVCPVCLGLGLIRVDWVKVPMWQNCSCECGAQRGNLPEACQALATPLGN